MAYKIYMLYVLGIVRVKDSISYGLEIRGLRVWIICL